MVLCVDMKNIQGVCEWSLGYKGNRVLKGLTSTHDKFGLHIVRIMYTEKDGGKIEYFQSKILIQALSCAV